jgi:hypothetical protein
MLLDFPSPSPFRTKENSRQPTKPSNEVSNGDTPYGIEALFIKQVHVLYTASSY